MVVSLSIRLYTHNYLINQDFTMAFRLRLMAFTRGLVAPMTRWKALGLVEALKCPQCLRPMNRTEFEVDYVGFGRIYKRLFWRCEVCHYQHTTERCDDFRLD
jgi:hypothetical protein